MKVWMDSLQFTNDFCVFRVGLMPEVSAQRIQRCGKRFLFKLKLKRLKKVYELLLEAKLERIYGVIRNGLVFMRNRLVINQLKFEVYKAIRLREICEKLAILRVKKQFRKNKLSFKVIKYRMKKFKRKLKFSQRQAKQSHNPSIDEKAAAFNLNNEEHELIKVPSASSSFTTTPKDVTQLELSSQANLEFDETQKVLDEIADDSSEANSEVLRRLEKERKLKLKKGFISYNISKTKPPNNVLPYLYQKDLMESNKPFSHHNLVTKATVTRMSESAPVRFSPNKARVRLPKNLYLSKPKTSKSSNRSRLSTPSYLKATFTHNNSRWDAELLNPIVEPEVIKKIASGDNKLSTPTFTFAQKRQEPYRPQSVDERPVWRPSTHNGQGHVMYEKPPKTSHKSRSRYHLENSNRSEKRTKSAFNPIPELTKNTYASPKSLSFQAALPEFTQILNHYASPLYVHLKANTNRVRGFLKQNDKFASLL